MYVALPSDAATKARWMVVRAESAHEELCARFKVFADHRRGHATRAFQGVMGIHTEFVG